tara:strand:+ start:176 stop:655 length:480 start_codon:yes stop_codon:yes gene_type:complete
MLKGRKIVLRSLEDSDLEFLQKIENNKENWQFGSERKKYSKQNLIDYIKHAKTDISIAKQYRFVIDLKGIAIGFIDLFDYNIESAGIGLIISKDYRNQGFAKEALGLLVEYAFVTLKMKQLCANIKKDNISSIKLFSSCNFIFQRSKYDLQYFVKFAEK